MPSKDGKDLAAADDSMKTHKPTNTRNHPGALRQDILQVAEQTRPQVWSDQTTRQNLLHRLYKTGSSTSLLRSVLDA